MGHQHWVVTNNYSKSDVPRGWKLHAVEAPEKATFEDIKRLEAACGLHTRRGWSIDLFITKKCARCLVALGLACPFCRGKGETGRFETWNNCYPCNGTGELSQTGAV